MAKNNKELSNKKFFFKVRNKFASAFRGVFTSIREESSLIVHILVSVIVIALGIWLQAIVPNEFGFVQWAIILITIGVVIGFELLNTMVENLVDLLTFEYDLKAKKIKDICAAATLINSVLAIVIGSLILIPPLIDMIKVYVNAA